MIMLEIKLFILIEKFNQQHDNVQLNVSSDASITLNQRTELLLKNAGMGVLLVLFFLAISVNRIRKRNPKQSGSPSYFYNNRNNHRTSAMFSAYPTANCFSHYL